MPSNKSLHRTLNGFDRECPMKHAVLLAALLAAFPSHGQDETRHEGYKAPDGFVGAWYHGERHIVCNAESTRKDGSLGHSMSILSYAPEHGYVYMGIGSRGRYETHEKGTFQNGVLEYTEQADGEIIRIRIGPFTDRTIIPFIVHTSRNGNALQPR